LKKLNKEIMEGLLPFLYKAIILYYADDGGWRFTGSNPFLRGESLSVSGYYISLPSDSGRLL
jgi:hypothetical protein